MNVAVKSPVLSKSRFMAGRQCHKRLYLEIYQHELAGSADESGEASLEVGRAVGALARSRYSGGALIGEELDWAEADRATQAAFRDRAIPAIFEGALSFDRLRVRPDILTRTRDRRFDLFEVKSTLDLKPEHEWDLAVQYHVLRGAGVPIRWARLMHLSRDYVYSGGDYDLKRLFTFTNLTRLVDKRRREVVAALKEMRRTLAAKSPPSISVGPQCSVPYACPFYDHCHGNEPDHSVTQLPRLGIKMREQFAAMGIIEIPKIPWDFDGLSTLQARVVEAVRSGNRSNRIDIVLCAAVIQEPEKYGQERSNIPHTPRAIFHIRQGSVSLGQKTLYFIPKARLRETQRACFPSRTRAPTDRCCRS
jgi:hypothetical protein